MIALKDLATTGQFAKKMAPLLQAGMVIFLHGDLGAGKTTLVRAILSALGQTGAVKSPSYSMVELYNLNDLNIYHFDLYRLTDAEELELIGIRDYLQQNALCIFEWPEKGAGFIPAADLEMSLDFAAEGRTLTLKANTKCGQDLLQKLNED